LHPEKRSGPGGPRNSLISLVGDTWIEHVTPAV
jgi:hypothetical protein